uniref:Uncharacterized protein n=1 Tax=Micrurus spixii TaxID=129469 RepID=A0A2D4LA97_9SAUR
MLYNSMVRWFNSRGQEGLQRVINWAQETTGCLLTPLDDITRSLCFSRVREILRDDSHPAQCLFSLLPLGRRYRSRASQPKRFKNSFYPWAVLNTTTITPCIHGNI